MEFLAMLYTVLLVAICLMLALLLYRQICRQKLSRLS